MGQDMTNYVKLFEMSVIDKPMSTPDCNSLDCKEI